MISYDTRQESKYIIYLDANNLYGYVISIFFPASGFKLIDPKEFNFKKNTINIVEKAVFWKLIPKYTKELRKLNNDHPLVPAKIKTKRNCWFLQYY